MGEFAKELEKDLPNIRAYHDTMARHQVWFVDEAMHAVYHLKKSGIVDEDDEAAAVELLHWLDDAHDATREAMVSLKNMQRGIIRRIEERNKESEENEQ